MSEKYFIFLVVGVLLLSSLIALAGILAVLPRAMDDFLLTNEDYCDIVVVSLKVKEESIYSKWNSKECSIDDAILNDVDIAVDEKVQVTRIQRQQERQQYSTKFQRMTNFVLWKIALHLWQQSTEDYDITDTSPKDYLPSLHAPNHHDGLVHTIDNECVQRTKYLHPLCDGYRKLRSRIQFEKLSYPWTWYFTSFIRMKNLTLHSLKRNVEFVSHQNYNQGMIGWSILPTREVVTPDTIKNYMETPDPSLYSQSNLPPAMEIETMDISLQSTWVHPVISAQVHGIVINFVIQSGEFLLPLHRSHHHHHHHGKSFNHTAFLIGDMTLQEVVQVLPKPPEVEGLFPRIGLVNITNVTLCVYENKDVANDGPSSLKVLMKIRVPDKFFFPITTMTIGKNTRDGKDGRLFEFLVLFHADPDNIFSPLSTQLTEILASIESISKKRWNYRYLRLSVGIYLMKLNPPFAIVGSRRTKHRSNYSN